jgi:hypothetical protein
VSLLLEIEAGKEKKCAGKKEKNRRRQQQKQCRGQPAEAGWLGRFRGEKMKKMSADSIRGHGGQQQQQQGGQMGHSDGFFKWVCRMVCSDGLVGWFGQMVSGSSSSRVGFQCFSGVLVCNKSTVRVQQGQEGGQRGTLMSETH